MALISIEASVGHNGQNRPEDVVAIAGALVAVGPDRGGIYAPPLSIEGLIEAIKLFQSFQGLPHVDGRVDVNGQTLLRINEILNPGAPPPAGGLRRLENPALATAANKNTWTPVESSLVTNLVFEWTSVAGQGTITYFQLDEHVVPRWFGALVPAGTADFDRLHLFFHPTPRQAHYYDADYHSLGNWSDIFHYLSDEMGAQLCAADTGRVLIMPLMSEASVSDCGVFPQRWESICSKILGMLKTGDFSGASAPAEISSVVVSSFSAGIVYSHVFRARAHLGARLKAVIDFDGIYSSYRQHSIALHEPAGHVIRMQQMPATAGMIGALAAQNTFPMSRERWGGPWADYYPADHTAAANLVHGLIPQTTMYLAARRAG